MEKIKDYLAFGAYTDSGKLLGDKINELIDAHNRTVEAVKFLARRLNTGTDRGTLEENINSILNS